MLLTQNKSCNPFKSTKINYLVGQIQFIIRNTHHSSRNTKSPPRKIDVWLETFCRWNEEAEKENPFDLLREVSFTFPLRFS